MLIYVGAGDWIPGIPARDLEEEEIAKLGIKRSELIRSGLYRELAEGVLPKADLKATRSNKVLVPQSENKAADYSREE